MAMPTALEHVAKIDLKAIDELDDRPRATYIGRKATISIRQASMGPTFGIKGERRAGDTVRRSRSRS